jgi:hypothetical protein
MFQKILHIGYKNFLKAVIIFGLISLFIAGLNFYGVIRSIELGMLLTLPSSFCGIVSFIFYVLCLLFSKDRNDITKSVPITVIGFLVAFAFFFFMIIIFIGTFDNYGV